MPILNSSSSIAVVGVGILTAALAGCARYEAPPQELAQHMAASQALNADGNGYRDTLVRQYRQLASYEHDEMKDDHSANIYAEKAVVAARDGDVPPEDPQAWNVDAPDIQQGYMQLESAKTHGGAKHEPVSMAIAQSRFDCWVEQQNEGFQPADIARCREGFHGAIGRVEQKVAEAQRMRSQKQTEKAAVSTMKTKTTAPKTASREEKLPFRLLFPFDSATLQPQDEATINKIARAIKTRDPQAVYIDGYADRAGPAAYNRKLSKERAKNVREALARRGVKNVQVRISTDWHGESDPAVDTADGVRNQFNRRVTVSVVGAETAG